MADESGIPELPRPPTAAELAAAVRAARTDRGMSQVALAQRAGTTPLTIRRIEAARLNPGAQVLFGVVVALGTALFWRHLIRAMGDPGSAGALLAVAGLAGVALAARAGGAVPRT